jgi:hypothetical protein
MHCASRARALVLGIIMLLSGSAAQAGKPGPANLVKKSRRFMVGPKAKIHPGDWASYNMKISAQEFGLGNMEVRFKLSSPIHSDAEHPLKPGQFWIEFEFASVTQADAPLLVLKMLVEGDPRDQDSIKRIYLQGGQRLPLEVPLEYLETDDETGAACSKGDEKSCSSQGGKVRRFKTKKMYTKMGWVKATRMQVTYPDKKTRTDFWVSDSVPIFQLVKAVAPDRMELELDSFGRGALSRIDEAKAVPMPDPEELARQLNSMAF